MNTFDANDVARATQTDKDRSIKDDVTATVEAREEVRVPVAEEQLVVQKRPVTLGTVHVHKSVEWSEQQLNVPYYRDEVVVEHLSPDAYHPDAADDPNVTVIPVLEEQVVVEKRTVVKEYIRIRRNRIEQQQAVSETVRREVVEVSEQPSAGVSLDETPFVRESR